MFVDQKNDIRRTVEVDDKDNFRIVTEQQCNPILERNKALKNDGTNGYRGLGKKEKGNPLAGELQHVASIPATILFAWLQEVGFKPGYGEMTEEDQMRLIRSKLNDGDWAYLKTIDGKI